jgi:signal transduction histidine kinase
MTKHDPAPEPRRSPARLAARTAAALMLVLIAAALWVDRATAPAAALAIAAVAAVAAVGAIAWGLEQRARSGRAAAALAEAVEAAARGEARERGFPSVAAAPAAMHRLVRAVDGLVRLIRAERHRMRDIAARAFRAQEAERLRIARELQERTAQELAVALLRLRAARGAGDPLERERLLDELRDGLVATTDDIRRYARALHPPALRDIGLVAAIEAYARALVASATPRIELDAAPLAGLLSPEGELALYRVVQESVGNAVRHAGAQRIRIEISTAAGWVEARVADDGCGFDVAAVQRAEPCLGLFGMQARALALGGEYSIDSGPAGTTVAVRLPVFVRTRPSGVPLPVVSAVGAQPEGVIA